MTLSRSAAVLALAIACGHAWFPAGREVKAVRERLGIAVERSVTRLGREGGFEEGGRIELPVHFVPLGRALHGTGMGARVRALESALNRAAESATAELAPWLLERAARFVPTDPAAVLAGPPDAATLAFRMSVEAPLAERLRPTLERTLTQAGAPEALALVAEAAARLPLPRSAELDLVALASERMRGVLFAVLAEEEASIRAGGRDAS